MFNKACEVVSKLSGVSYFNKILSTSDEYCFFLADEYGNSLGKKYFLNKSTFKVEVDGLAEQYGIECDVPEQYQTYKVKVIKSLSGVLDVPRKDVVNAVNLLYGSEKIVLSYDNLHRLCTFFISLINYYCSDYEKADIALVRSNVTVFSFLDLPLGDKLKCMKSLG